MESIVRSLDMDRANAVLLISIHNECRRTPSGNNYLSITIEEIEMLLVSNAVQLRIGLDVYSIKVRSVFTFLGYQTGKSHF